MECYVSKEQFIDWLDSKYGKKDTNSVVAKNLELVAASYSDYANKPFVIWESSDRRDIDMLITLLKYGFLGTFDIPYESLKEALVLFKKFVIHVDISRSNSHLEWRTNSNVDDEDDMKERLNTATAYLLKKYRNRYAWSLKQLKEENTIISFACFNRWTQKLYDMTATEYLREKGVLEESEERNTLSSEKNVGEKNNDTISRSQVDREVRRLQSYYRYKPVKQLSDIDEHVLRIPLHLLNQRIQQEYKMTAGEYMMQKGILEKPTSRGIIRNSKAKETTKSKKISRETQVKQVKEKSDNGVGLTVPELREWIKKESENSVKEYMKKQNSISLNSPVSQKETEGLAEQQVWDIYETALIVDVCYRMLYRGEVRNTTVSRLASSLRRRARDNGNKRVARSCDERTISNEISKIKYLFTDGEEGISGAGSLSKEVVSMKKQSPKLFDQLLCEALRQLEDNDVEKVDETETVENKSTDRVEEQAREMKQGNISFRRNDFRNWMKNNSRYKGDKIDPVVNAIDVGSEYVLNKKVYHLSFWEIRSRTEFMDISSTLLETKPFRVRVGKFINAYKRAFDIYTDYLTMLESHMQ